MNIVLCNLTWLTPQWMSDKKRINSCVCMAPPSSQNARITDISGISMAQYGSMLCIRHRYDTIWHNDVQKLIMARASGITMCIRHHNAAQTCALGKMRCIHDSSCASCINVAQCNMTHHTKLTTSYFVHFLFCYFVYGWYLKGKGKKDKIAFWLAVFATLTLLTGDFGCLVSKGSSQKGYIEKCYKVRS